MIAWIGRSANPQLKMLLEVGAGRLAASLALDRGLPSDIAALGVSDAALSPARFMRLT